MIDLIDAKSARCVRGSFLRTSKQHGSSLTWDPLRPLTPGHPTIARPRSNATPRPKWPWRPIFTHFFGVEDGGTPTESLLKHQKKIGHWCHSKKKIRVSHPRNQSATVATFAASQRFSRPLGSPTLGPHGRGWTSRWLPIKTGLRFRRNDGCDMFGSWIIIVDFLTPFEWKRWENSAGWCWHMLTFWQNHLSGFFRWENSHQIGRVLIGSIGKELENATWNAKRTSSGRFPSSEISSERRVWRLMSSYLPEPASVLVGYGWTQLKWDLSGWSSLKANHPITIPSSSPSTHQQSSRWHFAQYGTSAPRLRSDLGWNSDSSDSLKPLTESDRWYQLISDVWSSQMSTYSSSLHRFHPFSTSLVIFGTLCFDLVLYPFADNSHVPKLAAGNPTILIISSTNHFPFWRANKPFSSYQIIPIVSPVYLWLYK